MKRFHVHVGVEDIDKSIAFYTRLFGTDPTTAKPRYAKWLLDDPAVNFAISQQAGSIGLHHLGFQMDTDDEVDEAADRLQAGGQKVVTQQNVACCYATSNKRWAKDPAGIAWETFHTLAQSDQFGCDSTDARQTGCCAAQTAAVSATGGDSVQTATRSCC